MSSIKELIETQKSNELAEKRLQVTLDEMALKKKQLRALESKMLKEHADVEELEQMSLKSVFRKVLGDKEAQLEKERQEYLHAFMKFEEYKKTLDILEFEIGILQEKVANATDVSQQIKKQIAIRKKELMLNGSTIGKKISAIESEINKYYYIRKECLEAAEVGNSVVSLMEEMVQNLKSARSWGTFGGNSRSRGGMSKIIKAASIDKAKKLSHQVQHLLRVFRKELSDIHGQQNFDLSFNLDGFDSFLNIFFDNLISDWVVQRKIATSMNSVVNTQSKIKRIVYSLEVDIKNADENILQRKKQVEEILKEL